MKNAIEMLEDKIIPENKAKRPKDKKNRKQEGKDRRQSWKYNIQIEVPERTDKMEGRNLQ